MPSAEYDLGYLKTGSQQLEKYLLSDVLYWPVGKKQPPGLPPYPRITPGGLLLAMSRAAVTCQTNKEQLQFNKLVGEINNIRASWTVFWEKKGQREFNARLTLWKNFLEDYKVNPVDQFDRYSYEIKHRVQLELLHKDISINSDSLEFLAALELILKVYFQSGEFIWDEKLEEAFPPDSYWFLYGSLAEDIVNTETQ